MLYDLHPGFEKSIFLRPSDDLFLENWLLRMLDDVQVLIDGNFWRLRQETDFLGFHLRRFGTRLGVLNGFLVD